MKIEMNSLAIRKIREALEQENNPELKCRLAVSHVHGDHAHYHLGFDTKKKGDELVEVKGLEVLVGPEHREFLDGLVVKYLLYPQEGFKITNPSKNNHGDH